MMAFKRLWRTIRRDDDDRAVRDELELHIELETQDLVAQGVPLDDARRRAQLSFGDLSRVRAEAADARRGAWLSALPTELLWAWRAVYGRGVGAVCHVALVGVTVAATAVVFSAADSFVFNPVPYPNADRLMVFQRAFGMGGQMSDAVPVDELDQWRRQTDLFTNVEAYSSTASTQITFTSSRDSIVEAIDTAAVSPGMFNLLGVHPAYGRSFSPDDARPGAPAVAIVSAELARRLFDRSSAAVGRSIASGADALSIVGVMPDGFRFPRGVQQMWRPMAIQGSTSPTNTRAYSTIALRNPAISTDDLRRQVDARRPGLVANLSPGARLSKSTITSLSAARRDPRSPLLLLLLGAAGALLLLACVNTAGLEIAASAARSRVFAVQTALGATRSTLVRSLFLEGLLLSLLAAGVALALATWGASLLTAWLPPATTNAIANPIDVDRRVVLIALAAIAVTWLASAVPLVWRASRATLFSALRVGPAATMSKAQVSTRYLLLTTQMALSVVLLIGAVLFVRSYVAHVRQDRGFDNNDLMTLQVLPPVRMSAHDKGALQDRVFDAIRALPSVRSASLTESLLPSTTGRLETDLQILGRPQSDGRVQLRPYLVDDAYPATVGIRLRAGRWLLPTDPPGTVVIDEAFARRFWPQGDVLGAEFMTHAGYGSGDTRSDGFYFKVVGVAGRVRGDSVDDPNGDGAFVIYGQVPHFYQDGSRYAQLQFMVRLNREEDLGSVAAAVRQLAPGCVVRAELLDDRYIRLYGDARVAAGLTTGFGAVALLIAVIGVYALMSLLVTGRTREIGIRMAMGATGRDVQRELLRPSLWFISAGIVVGLAVSGSVARFVEPQLFGVRATDIATYGGVALLLALTGLVATWRPLRAAARVDPALTLRAE